MGNHRTARTSPAVLATRACPRTTVGSSGGEGRGQSLRPRCPAAQTPSATRGPWRQEVGQPCRVRRPGPQDAPTDRLSEGCQWRDHPADPCSRTGIAARRPRCGRIRRRRRAPPVPSEDHPAAGSCSSARNRPEDPPSSATVTMAVRRSVIRRSAVSDVDRPWPPPKATTAGSDGRRPQRNAAPRWSSLSRLTRDPHLGAAPCGYALARSRLANSSAIAVLRCLPPVQPMAIVAKRLPSCR